MNNQSDSKGFTLIELLVSLAISSIVLLLVTQMFISTNEMNTIQENVATVQQDIRAAMDIMSTDILMAGLDPSGTAANAGFVNGGSDISDTDSNSVAVRYDYDGDGVCEVAKSYYYNAASEQFLVRIGGASYPLTESGTIASASFSYSLQDGSVDSAPDDNGNLGNIKIVTVQICGKISGAYAAKHTATYCFAKNIKPRNM